MFAEWFRGKFEDWRRGKYGQESGQSAFAKFLDINQKSVNEYLNGKSIPAHEEIIEKLRKIYGNELLIAIGREPSTRDEIISLVDQFPAEVHWKVLKQLKAIYGEFEDLEYENEENSSDPEHE